MESLTERIRRHRLSMSFLLIIVLFFTFGAIIIRGLYTLGELTRTIYEHPLVVSNASLNAALNITKMHRSMKDVVLARSPDQVQAALEAVAEGEAKVYRQLDIIRKDILGREGRTLERQTRQLFVNWRPIRDEVVTLLESGRKQEAVQITKGKGADHVERLEAKMLELTSYARGKATGFLRVAQTRQRRLEKITIGLTVAGVLLSVLIALDATLRVLRAEKVLLDERDELQEALAEIKTLRGIIPICAHCKQIRDDEGMWKRMEEYIHAHSEASFSHGICPDCAKEHFPDQYASIFGDKETEE